MLTFETDGYVATETKDMNRLATMDRVNNQPGEEIRDQARLRWR